jgi:AcrR family transcriptional regulator
MDVFWERGFEETSINDLTAAMGINSPSLYAAFGSKEDLFLEAVELYDSSDGAVSYRALEEQPTARSAVEAMLRENVDLYSDPTKPAGCMIVLAAMTWTPRNETVRKYVAGLREKMADLLRERFERAVSTGEISPDVDIGALADYINTLYEGLSIQARDGASRETMHAIVDSTMASWDALTAPRSPSAQPGRD